MSQPYSRRSLLGGLAAAVLGLFFDKRAKANSAPKPPPFRYQATAAEGAPLSVVTDPLGSVTTYVYDSGGKFIYQTYQRGSGEPNDNGSADKR